VSTVNDLENTESTAGPEGPESPESPEGADGAARAENAEGTAGAEETQSTDSALSADAAPSADAAAPADEDPSAGGTTVYVRRGRVPTLGFWVALAIIVPAVLALLSAPLFEFADISGVLNFMLVVAVFVGLPLAALAALIDAIRHRRDAPRRR